MTPTELTEGRTRLVTSPKVFFNPVMESNRTITVSILNNFFKKPFTAIDALAGSGAKGLRIANETLAEKVILNDLNPSSRALMEKGIALNKLKNVEICAEDANVLLSRHKYSANFVDIDPFGSPAPFADAACRALLPKDAVLALTATDTGALAGSFPTAARRRYDVKVERTPFYNELGIRGLAGFAVRTAAKYDVGLSVLFAHATRHYYRVYLRTHRGATVADKAVNMVKPLLYCPKCGAMEYAEFGESAECHGTMHALGPIWAGPIYEENLFGELDTALPFFDMHVLYKRWGRGPEKFESIQEKLHAAGFKTSRTHFNPHAIRCDAPFKDFKAALSRA